MWKLTLENDQFSISFLIKTCILSLIFLLLTFSFSTLCRHATLYSFQQLFSKAAAAACQQSPQSPSKNLQNQLYKYIFHPNKYEFTPTNSNLLHFSSSIFLPSNDTNFFRLIQSFFHYHFNNLLLTLQSYYSQFYFSI